jgi:hypothetical protein
MGDQGDTLARRQGLLRKADADHGGHLLLKRTRTL